MNATKRILFFQETLTEFRELCKSRNEAVAERKFLTYLKFRLPAEFWEKHASKLDRHIAGLPHHKDLVYNEVEARKVNAAWVQARYLFMFGQPRCLHCGSKTGHLFDKLKKLGTGFQKVWFRYCSDSCSKSSTEALGKREATCLKRYKARNVSMSKGFKRHIKALWRGKDDAWWDARTEKTRATKVEKHGSLENAEAARAETMMKTNRQRYGGNAATCSAEVRAKVVATNLLRRGVSNPSKDPEVMQKIMTSWKNRKELKVKRKTFTGLQGYEPQVIQWLAIDRRVPVGRIKRPTFAVPYRFEGRDRHYHPDLLVKGDTDILIEVKSIYTSAIVRDATDGHGSYALNRAKINAAVGAGYETRFVIWHKDAGFVWKGRLPRSRKAVLRAFKAWHASVAS